MGQCVMGLGAIGGKGNRRGFVWGIGAYPRNVRRMFISKSAPQPAMRKTPRGGTGEERCQQGVHCRKEREVRTEDCDNHHENGGERICHFG